MSISDKLDFSALTKTYSRFQVDNPFLAPALEGVVQFVALGTLIDGRDWRVAVLSGALYGVGVRVGILGYYLGPPWWKNPTFETFQTMCVAGKALRLPLFVSPSGGMNYPTSSTGMPKLCAPKPAVVLPSVKVRIAKALAFRIALLAGAVAATAVAHGVFRYPMSFVATQLHSDYLSRTGLLVQAAATAVAIGQELRRQPTR